MSEPDFVICLECESPAYVFVWDGQKITEATCTTCGNEKATLFTTDEAYGEDMASDNRNYESE